MNNSFKKLLESVKERFPDLITEEAYDNMLAEYDSGLAQITADATQEGQALGFKEGYDEGKRVAAEQAKAEYEKLLEKLDEDAVQKLTSIIEMIDEDHTQKLQEIYDYFKANTVPKEELQNALDRQDEDYANKIYLNCKPTQLRLPKEFKCDEQGNLVHKSRWVVYTFNNDKVTEDLHFLDTPQYQKCMELAREYGLTLTKEKSIDYLNQPLVQNTSLNISQNSIVGNSNCTIQTEDKPQELHAENNHNLFKQMKNYIKNKREKSKEDLSESDMLFLR